MTPHLGIDVVDIGLFRVHVAKKNLIFLEKIFTKHELQYCLSTEDPAPHLAGRFAAKEAVVKALYSAGLSCPDFSVIEVVRSQEGIPTIVFNSSMYQDIHVQISISHAKEIATAVAMLSK
jgi:holo-[acyl-carrier protein] synthase